MAAITMKIGFLLLTMMATSFLVQGMDRPCVFVSQLCDMQDGDFDLMFLMCQESNEGRNVPAHGTECCKMINLLSGNCLCKSFELNLSLLPPDNDLTAPLQLPHKCGFPLDPPGCKCGRYLFPA